MITRALLKEIIADQIQHRMLDDFVARDIMEKIKCFQQNKEIIVISGLRRCGKSTVLQKIRHETPASDYYLNFEDDRLVNFTVADFQTLLETFIELFGEQTTFYFDEIQNIPEWERFVRRLYSEGKKIYITGSNASLLSKELGTRLTGRYIAIEMYPYSFKELVTHQNIKLLTKLHNTRQKGQLKHLFSNYCKNGGIPEYVRYNQTDYLHALYQSILYRDILARYKLTAEKPFKELVFYLASNIGKDISFNSLRKLLGLGSTSTLSDYCNYLENSYLTFFINRYSHSLKKQIHSGKKIYFIDHALAHSVGFRTSQDYGRLLENIVYTELKRRNKTIYFHKEKYECDFVIKTSVAITDAIQVCVQLETENTKQREYAGLLEAMETYNLKQGLILTDNTEQEAIIKHDRKKYLIKIVPIWKWLLEE